MKKILNIFLCLILIFSLYKILFKIVDYKKASTTYTQIEEIFINESKNNTKENIFPKMKDLNSDYSFWINVENTTVNYPVVKGNNNFDYLKQNFNKENSSSGSIFLDYRNVFTEDFNTLIYGHNMKNKTMFNHIENYKDEEFFKQNNKIKITDKDSVYTYEVFSVYLADGLKNTDPHYLVNASMDTFEIDTYISEIQSNSLHQNNLKVTPYDKIITFVTYSYESDDIRTLVHAKLIKTDKL